MLTLSEIKELHSCKLHEDIVMKETLDIKVHLHSILESKFSTIQQYIINLHAN